MTGFVVTPDPYTICDVCGRSDLGDLTPVTYWYRNPNALHYALNTPGRP